MSLILIIHQDIDIGRKDEADTLTQLEEISSILKNLGHSVEKHSCKSLSDIEYAVNLYKPQMVFNLVESLGGSDRYIYLAAGMLEISGVAFSGNKAAALYLTSDKQLLKRVLSSKNIAVPPEADNGNETEKYIVKSTSEHASFGIDKDSVITGAKQALKLVDQKTAELGGTWFAENYIEGREINVSLLEGKDEVIILPPAEILFIDFDKNYPRIVDYNAKWNNDSHSYKNTPRCFIKENDDITETIKDIALRCWSAIGLSGYARIDLRVDKTGKPWVIDVNANPCLSSDAGFIASAKEYGMTQQKVIKHLIENSLYVCNKNENRRVADKRFIA